MSRDPDVSSLIKLRNKIYDKWNIFYPKAQKLVHCFVLFILLVIVLELIRCFYKNWFSARIIKFLMNLRFTFYIISISGFCLLGVVFYYKSTLDRMSKSHTEKYNALVRENTNFTFLDGKELPIPPRPMHPTRLGGIYYRGNDERNPSLYNGGNYLTAKFKISLCNKKKERYEWQDELANDTSYLVIYGRQ